jgi:hypothetical protein
VSFPREKRLVFGSQTTGNVDVLALGDFDGEAGNEIGMLGRSGLALLMGTVREKSFLVGGTDGVLEYKLGKRITSDR